jgi:hypothetical protein
MGAWISKPTSWVRVTAAGAVALAAVVSLTPPAVADTPSACAINRNSDVHYVGPCQVNAPTPAIEFTASGTSCSQVGTLDWTSTLPPPYYSGIPEVDHVTGPDTQNRCHVFVMLRYAPASQIRLGINVGSVHAGAVLDITGNGLSDTFSNFKALAVTAQRMSGGRCLLKAPLSFFAIKDFAYQVGLKLSGGHPKRVTRRVTSDTQHLGFPDVPFTDASFQQWTFTRSLVLSRHQVRSLSGGHYKLRGLQSLSVLGSKKPSYATGRTVPLRKASCKSAMPVTL